PRNAEPGWEKTDLYQRAAAMPGVKIAIDEDGREARLFRAATSGYTLLYDANGGLLFTGGITAARGHEGDSAGQQALFHLLSGRATKRIDTPVFGCSLLGSVPK